MPHRLARLVFGDPGAVKPRRGPARRRAPRLRPEIEGCESRTLLAGYLGAAFGPYIKQWNGSQVPQFNSYGSGNASVANQIALVDSQFGFLATYSAGYAGYYSPTTPYNQVDSAWRVAIAAANYNKQQGRLAINVSQGIYQQATPALMAAEINGALKIAQVANAIYPGTVSRLIFTNEYVTDAATTNYVNGLITQYKPQARQLGLQVGVRSQTFGQLNGGSPPDFVAALQTLVKNVDFIMANLYPSPETTDIQAGVNNVAGAYNAIKTAATQLNPKIKVYIGETGWPSQGYSFNNPTGELNTVANARAYYQAITKWANANKVLTFYFEAIDEPWKSNQNDNSNSPNGKNGAEGHYGLWTYNSSGDGGRFVPKWNLSASTFQALRARPFR